MNIKENDLLICKPREGNITEGQKPFNIYARVAIVDEAKNRITLDAYQKEGAFRCNPRVLKPDCVKAYYVPMNQEEINEFYQGLKKLTNSHPFKTFFDLQEKYDVYSTFHIAKLQAKIKPKTIER